MILSALASEYVATRLGAWLLLDNTEATKAAIEAARVLHALEPIAALAGADSLEATNPSASAVTEDTDLTGGEWFLVRPLFVLYVELENSMRLEASRTLGVEVYGRATSEIRADIKEYETDILPRKAFAETGFTVGSDGPWN